MAYTFHNSKELFRRAARVIPQGIYGHLTPVFTVPGSYPYFGAKAQGCRFIDVDGNEYIDYLCAYGPMILGYAHKKIDQAYYAQVKNGTCTSVAPALCVELAERLVATIDCADWALFAKNGADTTSIALVLARGYTARNKIVLAHDGYHGSQPWAGTNTVGITPADRSDFILMPWGDIDSFKGLVEKYQDEIAGVMLTPYHHPVFADQRLPEKNYFSEIRSLCDRYGIVLIIDDIRAGWRLDLKGSAHYFGFKPDLACFSKAMANGYPISVIVGSEKMRITASKTYAAGTFWFNSGEMAAALACIDEMERIDAPSILKERGEMLVQGLQDLASSHGLHVTVSGPPAMPFMRFSNETNFMRSQLFCGECARNGVFFHPHHNWFLSTAHTKRDIRQTLDVADRAFKAVKKHFGE
ncbi:MAG TPA: aminotransferase class III-fold pyridoxal phosphate-dependent enzyme [Deltaproteobacteria bacterium]|nr:aminotransferase class III-fold pyridoxal phosphate-dependent enzyme [Deltaproteobacteria bacterium]HPR52117.1 aminotransferase class III-fold pyridoxal phosphate-dependent enzyme [Deltaproteobacteria bacterium]